MSFVKLDNVRESQPAEIAYHPAFRGRALYTVESRPGDGTDDEANTSQTIQRMREYAAADSRSPIVRRVALAATDRSSTARERAGAIHSWVRANVLYVPDSDLAAGISGAPADAEVLVRPVDLLTMPQPQGDCDCISMLVASLLRAVGIDSAFKAVAADPASPNTYSHVYVVARVPEPLALDGSHGPYAGWEVQPAGKSREWAIGARTMQGLGFAEGFDWGGLIKTGMETTGGIMKARYAVPQLSEGQTIQTNAGFFTQSPANSIGYPITQTQPGLNTGMLLLIGVGVLAVVLVANKR